MIIQNLYTPNRNLIVSFSAIFLTIRHILRFFNNDIVGKNIHFVRNLYIFIFLKFSSHHV